MIPRLTVNAVPTIITFGQQISLLATSITGNGLRCTFLRALPSTVLEEYCVAIANLMPGLVSACECCCSYNAGEDSNFGRETVTGNALRGAFFGRAPAPAHILPEQPCRPGQQLGCTPGINLPRVSSAWAVEVLD